MTTYLPGIFAKANGDTSKAQTLLKESFAMMPSTNAVKADFEKSYPSIVQRAILSTATKTALSYALNENSRNSSAALFASFVAAVYQIASTRADTRIWSTLPKEFQVARFKRPKNGKIKLTTSNNIPIKNIDLPDSKHVLIYGHL